MGSLLGVELSALVFYCGVAFNKYLWPLHAISFEVRIDLTRNSLACFVWYRTKAQNSHRATNICKNQSLLGVQWFELNKTIGLSSFYPVQDKCGVWIIHPCNNKHNREHASDKKIVS